MLTAYLKIFARELLRLLVRALYVFPVKKNRVLFESFQGRSFSDNPREVWRYLSAECGDKYECFCSLSDPSSIVSGSGPRPLRYKSLKWFMAQITSAVIVSNTLPVTVFPKRSGQLFIETWHGGGAYKTLGGDFRGYSPAQRTMVRWNNRLLSEKIDVFLSSSAMFSDAGIISPYGYTKNICFTGMPRNDIFFDPARVTEANSRVRGYYGVRSRMILYAPTWRGTNFRNTKRINTLPDFNRILDAVPDAVILFRRHYADKNDYTFGERIIDATGYPDMQDLLCAADMLITDYSSSIWDYALLGRPCFLYVPDLHEYENVEHGFCTPIDSWPGVVCTDMDALYVSLSTVDPAEHRKRAADHIKALGSYENGTACAQTAAMIREFTGI